MRMTGRFACILACFLFSLCANAFCLSAEETSAWDKLNLAAVEVGAVTIHYEKVLEPGVGGAKSAVEKYLADDAEWGRKWDKLIAEKTVTNGIDRILGWTPDEEVRAARERALSSFVGWSIPGPGKRVHIYFAMRKTVKDYLRAGGALPGFTYDKKKDIASYEGQLPITSGGQQADIHFAPPVSDPSEMAGLVSGFVDPWSRKQRSWLGIHEVVEASILWRMKTRDAHYRWFSTGFANVIAMRLTAECVGEEVAKAALADSGTARYAALEKDLNLLYWLGKAYEVETPLESERNLTYARYAYATLEAERIIDAHGIGCVKDIMSRLPAEGATASDITKAVTDATGEDAGERLKRYQRFETPEKGFQSYQNAGGAALERKDYAGALSCCLRMLELKQQYDARLYGWAAECLMRMGREDMADGVFQAQLKQLTPGSAEHWAIEVELVGYALRTGMPAKAYDAAEDVLAAQPDDVPALAVRLHRLLTSQKEDEAKKTAALILKLDTNPASFFHRKAQEVIGGAAGKKGTP